MRFKDIFMLLHRTVDEKFNEQFGFKFKEISFAKVVEYFHEPKDSSSLAVTRILFGLTMLFDIADERGGAVMHERWGESKICHFPLINFIQAIPMPYMALVYASLWIGALGITIGYKYRFCASLFTICYWYLFLIEKSYWNNHSYLFGLVSFLLTLTEANCFWSVDAFMEPDKFSEIVPYWNYFILKYQFFILYFMAGVKKGTAEWLTGYSVPNLSTHWVFTPFTLFLTVEQTNYFIVHWFIFLFDLTVAFWMMWSRSRHIAMVFCALFHLMNIRLFTIGMFPWVCLATMPLFYPFDWPKLVINFAISLCVKLKSDISNRICSNFSKNELISEKEDTDDESEEAFNKNVTKDDTEFERINDKDRAKDNLNIKSDLTGAKDTSNQENDIDKDVTPKSDIFNSGSKTSKHNEVNYRRRNTTVLIIIYMTIQGFLPFSHVITKGYNNWTNGLYGYSWDMMVHTWDVQSVVIKVIDNENNNQFYIDPNVFTPNDRWFKHGDMVHQYAMCLKKKLIESQNQETRSVMLSHNISIHIDVWCSMNGRFVQRMFDPRVDLLQVSWSPFHDIPFLMPVLDEASEWRSILDQIRSEVHSWDKYSDVIFFADFPGYDLEKYIPSELSNVTLTILQGQVVFEPEVTKLQNGQSYKLITGHRVKVDCGMFHRVLNIGKESAFYMYTFYNTTEANLEKNNNVKTKPKLPIIQEVESRFRNLIVFADIVLNGVYDSFFRLPMFLV